jgi:hypothetical protein
VLPGKKVRENPLLDGIQGGLGKAEDAPVSAMGGFGSQQQFQLGKTAAIKDDDDEEGEGDKKDEKKVRR